MVKIRSRSTILIRITDTCEFIVSNLLTSSVNRSSFRWVGPIPSSAEFAATKVRGALKWAGKQKKIKVIEYDELLNIVKSGEAHCRFVIRDGEMFVEWEVLQLITPNGTFENRLYKHSFRPSLVQGEYSQHRIHTNGDSIVSQIKAGTPMRASDISLENVTSEISQMLAHAENRKLAPTEIELNHIHPGFNFMLYSSKKPNGWIDQSFVHHLSQNDLWQAKFLSEKFPELIVTTRAISRGMTFSVSFKNGVVLEKHR